MGGERWLLMSSAKEARAAMGFFAPLRENEEKSVEFAISWSFGEGQETYQDSCLINFSSARRIEVSFSFGGSLDDSLAIFVCREIARRFKVSRVGADSVGWYPDSEWKSSKMSDRYGEFENWADWLKAYVGDWNAVVIAMRQFDPNDPYIDVLKNRSAQIEEIVVAIFDGLDKKAA